MKVHSPLHSVESNINAHIQCWNVANARLKLTVFELRPVAACRRSAGSVESWRPAPGHPVYGTAPRSSLCRGSAVPDNNTEQIVL